ncbi:MAG: hypothetical protein RIQ89_1455 [Bacteroidota bacterium]|jgi:GalNAc5-diNAcBac-PP-undecaprenol beta-1,3-glucosyltransferase
MNCRFFSIVIPAYNRAAFLPDTINSILNQTFNDFEIIVVDDGSTDNTQAVIAEIAKNTPQLVYIYQDNAERGAARNNGFKNARGQYVIFLDSDDQFEESHLITLYNAIQRTHYPDFLATKIQLLRNGKKVATAGVNLKEGFYDINLFLEGAHFACNYCVKKNQVDLIPFIEDRKFSVIEDWIYIAENTVSKKIFIIDKATVLMNDHDQRSMRGNQQMIIIKHILATGYISGKIDLTTAQRKKLYGHSWYFCAIHSYIDNKRKDTFSFLLKALKYENPQLKHLTLAIKAFIGYSIISKIFNR